MVNLSNLRFDDRAPVYQQIAEYLKRQILLGTVQDGDPMPSRRELAAFFPGKHVIVRAPMPGRK